MPDRLFGLPSHPLLVHLPVVLLPLAALLMLWLVVRPQHLSLLGLPLVGLSLVSLLGAVLAVESGEGLERILNEPSKALERHAQMGERTRLVAAVFFVLVVAFYFLGRKWNAARVVGGTAVARSKAFVAVGVVAALFGIVAIGAVVTTGHSGAKLAWEDAGKEG
jgi:hypothetical protein